MLKPDKRKKQRMTYYRIVTLWWPSLSAGRSLQEPGPRLSLPWLPHYLVLFQLVKMNFIFSHNSGSLPSSVSLEPGRDLHGEVLWGVGTFCAYFECRFERYHAWVLFLWGGIIFQSFCLFFLFFVHSFLLYSLITISDGDFVAAFLLFNFYFLFFYSINTNYKLASEGFTICTHRHHCPRTSHRIRKKNVHWEKREETLRKATEEDPSPGWTDAIDVMWPEGIITELHKQIERVLILTLTRGKDLTGEVSNCIRLVFGGEQAGHIVIIQTWLLWLEMRYIAAKLWIGKLKAP